MKRSAQARRSIILARARGHIILARARNRIIRARGRGRSRNRPNTPQPLQGRETNGDRTRDSRNHNPVLYQLSYGLRECETIPNRSASVNRSVAQILKLVCYHRDPST